MFLYGEACQRQERRVLGAVRNLEFETLCELVGTDPDFEPDHGPARMHPSAGAFAVGARPFLIAYNINLRSSDVGLATGIPRPLAQAGLHHAWDHRPRSADLPHAVPAHF